MPTIQAPLLADFISRLFQGAGAPEAKARLVANSLVESNLAGHDSHGVIRAHWYLRNIKDGTIKPAAEPVVVKDTPTVTTVDGQYAFGHVAAHFAMQITIKKAKLAGLAATGIFNCRHIGRVGEWVEMAAQQNLIALAFCDVSRGAPIVAPYGSVTSLLSTNPFAAAVPLGGQPPMVLDFATSVVAEGKVRVAFDAGKPIPEGWVIRADGQPTTDPKDLYEGGMLLPAAGHKGYGLAMLMEFLGSALVGQGDITGQTGHRVNGVLFIALAIEPFRPLADFLADGASLYQQVKVVPPVPGVEEVLIPGEPERQMAARRRVEGIPLAEQTWTHLLEAAAELGVAAPGEKDER
jgi:hydroxycarboxylate dehydrogenase B